MTAQERPERTPIFQARCTKSRNTGSCGLLGELGAALRNLGEDLRFGDIGECIGTLPVFAEFLRD